MPLIEVSDTSDIESKLEDITAWVDLMQDVLEQCSPSEVEPLPPEQIDWRLRQFESVLVSKPSSCQQLSTMTRAVSNLLTVTQGLTGREEQLVRLVELLLTALLDLYEGQAGNLKDVRNICLEFAEIVEMCKEDGNTKRLLLGDLAAQLLAVVASNNMITWIRREFLKVHLNCAH